MSDVYKSELKFGGKVLVSNISQQTSDEEKIPNLNSVYLDAPAVNNVDKSQLYIDPVTHKISLGRTRIQEIKPDWSGKITQYNVFLNTSLVPTEQEQQEEQGEEIRNKILSVTEGDGILIDFEQDDLRPVISIDRNVVATKDEINHLEDTLQDVEKSIDGLKLIDLDVHSFYDMFELLKVLDVVYSSVDEKQQNTLEWQELSSNTDKSIIGFSYKYIRQEQLKGLNCLRIRTNSTEQNNSYCVIHKCASFQQSSGVDYLAPETIYEYLDGAEVLTISKYPAKLNKEKKCYEWYFSKRWDMKHEPNENTVYLITFHKSKNQEWKWADRAAVNVITSSQSSIKSNLQYSWDNDFGIYDTMPYASFSSREPIGTLIKPQEK